MFPVPVTLRSKRGTRGVISGAVVLRIASELRDRTVRSEHAAIYLSSRGLFFDTAYWHEEHHVVDHAGDKYVIRWQIEDFETKYPVTHPLSQAMIEDRVTPEMKRQQPISADGSRLLIVVEPHDTIGWVIDQLGVDGCATLGVYAGGEELILIPWGRTGATLAHAGGFVERWGLTGQNTVGALEAVLYANGQEDRIHRLAVPKTGRPSNPWTTCLFFLKGSDAAMRVMLQDQTTPFATLLATTIPESDSA